jgi:two-component system NtrC family sensor kinase
MMESKKNWKQSVKNNIRRKIEISFTFFVLASSLVWSLNYYNHYQLTRKLQLIEQKVDLLNTVLEARRYEKNFFLYFNRLDLEQAVNYAVDAEIRQKKIIQKHEKDIPLKTLTIQLDSFQEYHKALSDLLRAYDQNPKQIVLMHPAQRQIRIIGKKNTDSIEQIVIHERTNVRKLIRKTNFFLYMALIAIFFLTSGTALFIIINVNRPLKRIENAIQKIARGDYSSIPSISTGDIFESLVNSVNIMVNELNHRNDQLVHSQKLASLGTLTSGVAHELNNPLNNISTSIQILIEELEDSDPEYNRKLLQETENQVDRARDIIKGLLEFSRERNFMPQQIRFEDLLNNALKLVKAEIPANISINLDIQEDLSIVVGPYRMQRVLMNLILNAVHAMENGGTMTIVAKQTDENEIFFQVMDTGTGISKEDIGKVFDPFYTTKEVGKGTGLGLSVSHGIVEKHGGRIEVESEVGKGAVFTVFLPHESCPPKE